MAPSCYEGGEDDITGTFLVEELAAAITDIATKYHSLLRFMR